MTRAMSNYACKCGGEEGKKSLTLTVTYHFEGRVYSFLRYAGAII